MGQAATVAVAARLLDVKHRNDELGQATTSKHGFSEATFLPGRGFVVHLWDVKGATRIVWFGAFFMFLNI